MANWPRDAFGLLVRALGLMFIVYSLFDAFHVVAKTFNFESAASVATLGFDLAATIFFAILGIATIARAEMIVALAYGAARPALGGNAPGQ